MASTKLTLSIEPAVITRSKSYAKRQGKSLSKIVEELLLERMALEVQPVKPIIDMEELDRLSGPPVDIDLNFTPKSDFEASHKRIMEKYLALDDQDG